MLKLKGTKKITIRDNRGRDIDAKILDLSGFFLVF